MPVSAGNDEDGGLSASYDVHLIQFSTLLKDKQYTAAIDYYEEFLVPFKVTGDYDNNLMMLIYCHIELSNFSEAISFLKVSYFLIYLFLFFIIFFFIIHLFLFCILIF